MGISAGIWSGLYRLKETYFAGEERRQFGKPPRHTAQQTKVRILIFSSENIIVQNANHLSNVGENKPKRIN